MHSTLNRGELPTIAHCADCRRGYVSVNQLNPDPRCLACGGPIKLDKVEQSASTSKGDYKE